MSATENAGEGLSWGCALGAAVLVVGIMLLVRLDNPPMEWFESNPKASGPIQQRSEMDATGAKKRPRLSDDVTVIPTPSEGPKKRSTPPLPKQFREVSVLLGR